jgi:hypothetical protein
MTALPPGQRERADLPRFGLTPYANRFPAKTDARAVVLGGDAVAEQRIDDVFEGLPRVELVADLHCVTTWSRRGLRWSGVRYADVHERHVAPLLAGARGRPRVVLLRGQDGYRTTLPLDDLLAGDVLLADRLDGAPLPVAHGAPLRLVLPAHYGYKSVKHLCRIEVWRGTPPLRRGWLGFMDHPRARVAVEERGRWLPGPLLRRLYRPLIAGTERTFARALARWQAGDGAVADIGVATKAERVADPRPAARTAAAQDRAST